MRIPDKINKGDSVSWLDDPTSDNLGEELSPGTSWILHYAIRGSTSGTLDLVALTEGSQWRTSITAIQSAALPVGDLYFQAYVIKGSERRTLGSGKIKILADLSQVTGTFDGRTQSRQDLDAVQTAIRSLISGGAVQEYMVAGRSVRKMTIADLYMVETKLKFEVAKEERAEKIKSGLGDPHNLFVRFR
jgi:hypothetical protein